MCGFCDEAGEPTKETGGATEGAERGAAGGGAIDGARGAIGAFDAMRFVAGGGMLTGDLLTGDVLTGAALAGGAMTGAWLARSRARSASACAMSAERPCAVAASS